MGIELLLIGAQRIPRRNFVRPRREPGAGRDDAQLLLPRKRLFPQLVPALVELALELRDPFLGRVVRRVGEARRVVGEERLVGSERILLANPPDGLVRHQLVEVRELAARLFLRPRLAWCLSKMAELPLVRVAADKAVKILKAQAGGPQVEWPCRARLPVGHVVVLAKPRGVVAVLLENLAHSARALGRSASCSPDTLCRIR